MRTSIFASPATTFNYVSAGLQKIQGRSKITVKHREYGGVKLSAGSKSGQGLWCAISGLEYEPELRWLIETSDADSVFVDVGANIGVYSVLYASKHRRPHRVYSLEPSPQAFELLRYNIDQNGLTACITPLQCGMADRSGICTLDGEASKWNSLRITSIEDTSETASEGSIHVISLTDLVEQQGLTRLDFLKLDAEGQEGQILQSSLEVLRRFRPKIIVEVTCPESTRLVTDALKALDYRTFKLLEESPNCVAVPSDYQGH